MNIGRVDNSTKLSSGKRKKNVNTEKPCHPEQGEGSLCTQMILRLAQDDSFIDRMTTLLTTGQLH